MVLAGLKLGGHSENTVAPGQESFSSRRTHTFKEVTCLKILTVAKTHHRNCKCEESLQMTGSSSPSPVLTAGSKGSGFDLLESTLKNFFFFFKKKRISLSL